VLRTAHGLEMVQGVYGFGLGGGPKQPGDLGQVLLLGPPGKGHIPTIRLTLSCKRVFQVLVCNHAASLIAPQSFRRGRDVSEK